MRKELYDMAKESAIVTLAETLSEAAKRISSLALGDEVIRANDPEFTKMHEDIMYDELHHAQMIVVELTRLIAGESNTDEAFVEGELNSVVGEQEEEKPEASKE